MRGWTFAAVAVSKKSRATGEVRIERKDQRSGGRMGAGEVESASGKTFVHQRSLPRSQLGSDGATDCGDTRNENSGSTPADRL